MQANLKSAGGQRGFSLLELMVVAAIIAIISAVAYPSYMRYVVSTKRTTATSTLLQIADRQQQFFMDNKRYADDLTNLGFAADPLILTADNQPGAPGDPGNTYRFDLSDVSAITYTATATPLNEQGERDTDCGNLTLTQAAAKDQSGPGDGCW